jgi:undecaprenyl-diphosphatase
MRLLPECGFLGSALCLVIAFAVALSVTVAMSDTPMWGEARIVREMQGWAFPGERLSDVVRALTTTWLIIVLGCVLAAGLAVSGARREALMLLAMIVVLSWLQPALKEIIDRPRPTEDMFDIRGSITSESFPAGHVMGPTVLYGYVIALCATERWRRELRVVAGAVSVGLLALTGVVNLWLGVHWPADVVGGYVWGASIVLGAMLAARAVGWPARERGS